MSYRVCLICGDGIGAEVIPAARDVLSATGLPLCLEEAEAGWGTFGRHGVALPEESVQRVAGYHSPAVGLRRALDLYACVRPVRSPRLPGTARSGLDLVVIRENAAGLYGGREMADGERAVAERVITRAASTRIAGFALEYARGHGRRISLVHKANVLRGTCGLFREAALHALRDAAPIEVDELLVDTAAYQMVRAPERFDVVVTTNLFGDILSDAASAWGGGLGLAASANIGTTTALFEPVHGLAPDIAGKGIANPIAAFGAAALLLDYLHEERAARRLRQAIDHVLALGPRTPDLGGTATTADVTRAVISALAARAAGPTVEERSERERHFANMQRTIQLSIANQSQ